MTAPQLGVVGAPDIAQALSTLGFDVITDDGFREAATAISTALKGGAFPLVIADSDYPVVVPWTTVTAQKVSSLVILDTEPGSGLLPDRPDVHLSVPATFNEMLAKLGYAGAPDPLGSTTITASGSLEAEETTVPAPGPLPLPGDTAATAEPDGSELVAEPEPTADSASDAASPAAPVFGAGQATSAPQQPVTSPSVPTFEKAEAPLGHAVDRSDGGTAPTAPTFGRPSAVPTAGESAPELPPFIPPTFHAPAVTTASHAPSQAVPSNAESAGNEPSQEAPPPAWTPPAGDRAIPAWEPEGPATPATEKERQETFTPAQSTSAPRPEPAPVTPLQMGAKHAELIVCAAGKGGVGKTSSSILLAEAAAEQGLQAIVIDANRGQADIRKYLRLGEAPLRSAYDASTERNPAAAVLMPRDFAPMRNAAKLAVPDFGIVLGPPSDFAGSRYASAAVYDDIIGYCRSIADLVIVDTQIMEAPEERSDLWSDTILPTLGDDAWLLAITDESSAGVDNLYERLSELHREGVSPSRTLILASKFLEFGGAEVDYFQRKFEGLGAFVGNTGIDDDFSVQLNLGKVHASSASIRPAINSILRRTTGRDDLFTSEQPGNASGRGKPSGPGRRFGIFGRKKS